MASTPDGLKDQNVDRRVRWFIRQMMGGFIFVTPENTDARLPGDDGSVPIKEAEEVVTVALIEHREKGCLQEEWHDEETGFTADRLLYRGSVYGVHFQRSPIGNGLALQFSLRCQSDEGKDLADSCGIRVRCGTITNTSSMMSGGWEESSMLELKVLWDQRDNAPADAIQEVPMIGSITVVDIEIKSEARITVDP